MFLPSLTISEARQKIAKGDLCPVDYVETLVARIELLDNGLNTISELNVEQAIAHAKKLRVQKPGRSLPPLFGIPFLVKDIMDVEGSATRCQSRITSGKPAPRNAIAVQRVIDFGGIYLGKTALDEFALGDPDLTEDLRPVRNPWNHKYTAGGSSSGSGAAVAALFSPLALGSDTGGSIRSPAAMNGVVGLKPTQGTVETLGLQPLAPSMDVVGPIARTVEDVSLAFGCLINNPNDPRPKLTRPPELASVDSHWRYDAPPDADVDKLFGQALDDLRSAGAVIQNHDIPSVSVFNACGWTLLFSEAFKIHEKAVREKPEMFGSDTLEQLLRGAHISDAEYGRAQELRALLSRAIDTCLVGVDAIILPVSTVSARKRDDTLGMEHLARSALRIICNVTGHPAMALPMGKSVEGLPVGLQIIGHKQREDQLFAVGSWIERKLTAWHPNCYPDLKGSSGSLPPSTASDSATPICFSERSSTQEAN